MQALDEDLTPPTQSSQKDGALDPLVGRGNRQQPLFPTNQPKCCPLPVKSSLDRRSVSPRLGVGLGPAKLRGLVCIDPTLQGFGCFSQIGMLPFPISHFPNLLYLNGSEGNTFVIVPQNLQMAGSLGS